MKLIYTCVFLLISTYCFADYTIECGATYPYPCDHSQGSFSENGTQSCTELCRCEKGQTGCPVVKENGKYPLGGSGPAKMPRKLPSNAREARKKLKK